eukprot:3354410-Pleurochrysis_carterae.AAC.1
MAALRDLVLISTRSRAFLDAISHGFGSFSRSPLRSLAITSLAIRQHERLLSTLSRELAMSVRESAKLLDEQLSGRGGRSHSQPLMPRKRHSRAFIVAHVRARARVCACVCVCVCACVSEYMGVCVTRARRRWLGRRRRLHRPHVTCSYARDSACTWRPRASRRRARNARARAHTPAHTSRARASDPPYARLTCCGSCWHSMWCVSGADAAQVSAVPARARRRGARLRRCGDDTRDGARARRPHA